VAICGHCGIVAPTDGTACEICKHPLAQTRLTAPALPADNCWVAVRCGFTCNSCKFLAPLDGIDADGAVDCVHCGLRQHFEVSAWVPALGFAHDIGDLAGPAPEGRCPHPTLWIGSENPYQGVGDAVTFAQLPRNAYSALSIEATPGFPVCAACHVPLDVTVTGPGACTTACPRCGVRAVYALPDGARNLDELMVAVIADEHRTECPQAQRTTTQAGVTALACPSCGGPLRLAGTGRLQVCAFCNASCIVPARHFARNEGAQRPPDVFWILFRGPSPKRAELEQPVPAQAAAAAVAMSLLKPQAAATDTIGNTPGVYEAPERPGIHWPQVLLTLALGTVALIVGWLVTGR